MDLGVNFVDWRVKANGRTEMFLLPFEPISSILERMKTALWP